MVENAVHSASSVLAWRPHVDCRLASLWVVCNAGRGNLSRLELDAKQLFEFQLLQIFVDDLLSFFLGEDVALSLEVERLRPILSNE